MPSLLIFNPLTKQVKDWRYGGITDLCLYQAKPGELVYTDETTPTENEMRHTLSGKVWKYMKVEGTNVIDMTQGEKDQVDSYENSVKESEHLSGVLAVENRFSGLNQSKFPMTKADAVIDNIQNLNDAKTFLKKLVRWIADLRVGE